MVTAVVEAERWPYRPHLSAGRRCLAALQDEIVALREQLQRANEGSSIAFGGQPVPCTLRTGRSRFLHACRVWGLPRRQLSPAWKGL